MKRGTHLELFKFLGKKTLLQELIAEETTCNENIFISKANKLKQYVCKYLSACVRFTILCCFEK